MRTLRYGCEGADVLWLQHRLNEELGKVYGEKYIPIEEDGEFGSITKEHVEMYQRSVGLKDDGKVGPATRKKLDLSDFMVWILDPKKDKLWVAGTPYGSKEYPLKTLEQWSREQGADITWNLAFFNRVDKGVDRYGPTKGRTLTYCRGKGKDIGYGGTNEQINIDGANRFGGYKLAIKDGKRCKVSVSGWRARNANGRLKDGRIFVVQTCTKQTEYAVVSHMLQYYDVDLMLIQDSGGSTGVYFAANDTLLACEREGKNGRPVATALCLKRGGV